MAELLRQAASLASQYKDLVQIILSAFGIATAVAAIINLVNSTNQRKFKENFDLHNALDPEMARYKLIIGDKNHDEIVVGTAIFKILNLIELVAHASNKRVVSAFISDGVFQFLVHCIKDLVSDKCSEKIRSQAFKEDNYNQARIWIIRNRMKIKSEDALAIFPYVFGADAKSVFNTGVSGWFSRRLLIFKLRRRG